MGRGWNRALMAMIGILAALMVYECRHGVPELTREERTDTMNRLRELVREVRLYKEQRGEYPASLMDLSNAEMLEGLSPGEVPHDRWGRPFRYTTSSTEVVIWSEGPDPETTADDLRVVEER